jgi:threonyl-tRNA synthetase
LPVTANQLQYAKTIRERLLAHQIRCEVEESTSTIGYKIRQAEIRKTPYMLIIGEQETKLNKISVRKHKIGTIGLLTIQETVTRIKSENV